MALGGVDAPEPSSEELGRQKGLFSSVQFNTYFLRYVWYRMQVVIVYNQIHDFLSFCGVARKYDVASSSFQLSRTCRGHP